MMSLATFRKLGELAGCRGINGYLVTTRPEVIISMKSSHAFTSFLGVFTTLVQFNLFLS